jgi:glycosyltransferase involved in cell wall biosynthesis
METLPRAIDSALNQTLTDVEILVVDDASTDETASVVQDYSDLRVTYLAHEENRGGSAARNTGIRSADGTYIAFLDSDDRWHPEKLERQVRCLEQRSNEWVAAYCGIRVEPPENIQLLRSIAPDRLTSDTTNIHYGKEGGRELIRDVLMRGSVFGGASTLMVKRETVCEIGRFDESFPRHQDLEFLIRVLKRGKLAYVDDILVTKYSSPDGGPSSSSVARSKRLMFDNFEEEIERLQESGCPVKKHHQLELARHYSMDGRFRDCFECLLRPDRHLRHDDSYTLDDLLEMLWPITLGVSETV